MAHNVSMAIYLDHNATTPLAPEAAAAMAQAFAAGYANPASQHAAGRQARAVLEDARERIGALFGAKLDHFRPDRVLFTSGGTEANNLAIFGLAESKTVSGPRRVIVSPVEHPCIRGAADELRRRGFVVDMPRVTNQGIVEPEELARLLAEQSARVVSIQLANHETGVLQPIAELAAVCAKHNVPMHTDAVQAAGKLALDVAALGVAAMTVSAHKFNGPTGVGALVLRHGVDLAPQLFGGFQQEALRPGTESIPQALGMLAALEVWQRERPARIAHLEQLSAIFDSALLAGDVGAVLHGSLVSRLPQTWSVGFPGVDRQALFLALDLAGVACSTGSACASGSSEPSPILSAMGLPEALLKGSLRFSGGTTTTVSDVTSACDRILKCCKSLQTVKLAEKGTPAAREQG